MAVRRVSDLPNLDVVYQNSQLSNCLIEVSYTPNPQSNPRLYQSFYEHGSSFAVKVGNYLTNSNSFITPADLSTLGIGDLADLINMLNGLLNTEDLYLFVAQCGAPYSVVNGTGGLRYESVELHNGSDVKVGKTLVWKSDPNTLTPNFNSYYYTAQKHDLIFFKTIYDAMKAAQRFKFLEGAGIKIIVCTDLVEPLKVNFSVQAGNKVKINSVSLMSQNLTHSDSCALEITGMKINSMSRVYSKQTKKLEYCKMSFTSKMRTIYRDAYSLYNARYGNFVSSNLVTTYSYIIFDAGSFTKYDNITGSNQCIATGNSDSTQFNCVAFLKHDIAVIGSNIRTSNCSFSRCGTCLYIIGGNRTTIANSFESLSCTTVVSDREAGTLIRDQNASGLIYIKSTANNANFGTVQSNGIINVKTAINYAPNRYNQFISAAVKSSYSASDWTDVSYSDMKNYIYSHQPSVTSLGKFAVNPLRNALVIDVGNNRKIYEYDCGVSDFSNFMKEVTGNTPSRTPSDNESYTGPTTTDGYLDFSVDRFQQTVVSYSNLYDDYETARFSITSRLRSAFTHGNQLTMENIWDSDRYRSNYKNDGQLQQNIANNEKFNVNVTNDPDTGESVRQYEMLNDVSPISPTGYSLQQYRTEDHTTNYSFDEINFNDAFKQLTSTMETQYGYIISQA